MNTMLRQKALEFAMIEVRNKVRANPAPFGGDRIQEYLASVGITFPTNYCLAFVYWAYQRACGVVGTTNRLPFTGSCSTFKNSVHPSWIIGAVEPPQLGDIYIRRKKNGNWHAGLIAYASGARGGCHTAEGNTYTGESLPHNWGVHLRKSRTLAAPEYWVIRPTWY